MIEYIKSFSDGPIKMAIYGLPGTGKTYQYATIQAAGYKPIIFNFENGLKSLEEFLRQSGGTVAAIDMTQEQKLDAAGNPVLDANGSIVKVPIPRGRQRLKKLQGAIQLMQLPETRAKFDTIFVDTLSEVADMMKDVAQEEEEKQPKPDMRRAWGDYALELTKLIYALRDLPGYNVVFVCQEELDKDELTGQRFYGPEIPGKAAKGPFFQSLDMMYRLFVDNKNTRFFQTEPSATIKAKHRGSKLQAIEPADLGAIMKRIKNGENGRGTEGSDSNRASAGASGASGAPASAGVRSGQTTKP